MSTFPKSSHESEPLCCAIIRITVKSMCWKLYTHVIILIGINVHNIGSSYTYHKVKQLSNSYTAYYMPLSNTSGSEPL